MIHRRTLALAVGFPLLALASTALATLFLLATRRPHAFPWLTALWNPQLRLPDNLAFSVRRVG